MKRQSQCDVWLRAQDAIISPSTPVLWRNPFVPIVCGGGLSLSRQHSPQRLKSDRLVRQKWPLQSVVMLDETSARDHPKEPMARLAAATDGLAGAGGDALLHGCRPRRNLSLWFVDEDKGRSL